jgi:phosphoribosylglycinamide formyltransferase 1
MVKASPRRRVGILISGRGSNMDALIAAANDPAFPASIEVVISNRSDAYGLEKAQANGIATSIVDHQLYPSRAAFEAAMHTVLLAHRVDILCNAGFLRVLTPQFVAQWRDRHLNIHPSLLPAFPGLHTHERVLGSGTLMTGCTVHVVRATVDAGPIIAQAAVPVLAGDSPDSLAARVLCAEHQLYPYALALFATGRARVMGERVIHEMASNAGGMILSPPPFHALPDAR